MPLSEKNIFRPFFIHRKIISFPLFLIILGFFPRIEGLRVSYISVKNWRFKIPRLDSSKKKARNRAVDGVLRIAAALVYELRAQ